MIMAVLGLVVAKSSREVAEYKIRRWQQTVTHVRPHVRPRSTHSQSQSEY